MYVINTILSNILKSYSVGKHGNMSAIYRRKEWLTQNRGKHFRLICYIPETSEDIKNLFGRYILETLFLSTVDSLWPK